MVNKAALTVTVTVVKTYKPRCVSHIVVLNVTTNSFMSTAINSITANIESKVLHHTVVVLT